MSDNPGGSVVPFNPVVDLNNHLTAIFNTLTSIQNSQIQTNTELVGLRA